MPMSLRAHRPELPEWADTIVQRALAKSPADRFQTAEEFREALAATGLLSAGDVAKTIEVVEGSGHEDSPQVTITDTLVMPPIEASGVRSRIEFTWMHGALAVLSATAVGLAFIALRPPATDPIILTPPPRPAAAGLRPPLAPRRPLTDPVLPATTTSKLRTTSSKTTNVRRPEVEPEAPVTPPAPVAAPLHFETKAIVRIKGKYKERDAQLALANGMITVTADDGSSEQLCSFPFDSVLSMWYSRGRDPLWNSPQGPAPVARGGGALGRMGISFGREWIALRTNTQHQFVALRFDDVLVKRAILALEERTGRTTQFIEERKERK
jgi:hypothetical protein